MTFLPSGLVGIYMYKKKYFYFLINYSLRIIMINLAYKHIRSLFILQIRILYIILLKKKSFKTKKNKAEYLQQQQSLIIYSFKLTGINKREEERRKIYDVI